MAQFLISTVVHFLVDIRIKHEHFLKKGQIQIKDSNIIILTSEDDKEKMKQTLELWYRQKAREKILERISLYESIIVRVPGRIVIKSQKCRWGSCSSRGNLNFNWRLVMAPVEVIDYIVVHEMCHLIELNHSYRFWSLVAQVMPNYKQNKQWLEKNGAKLGW
ncbi:MAG: M48 family metallopeptidase [Syntrophomonadaceae bacterium]